jgi:hypothetical protein
MNSEHVSILIIFKAKHEVFMAVKIQVEVFWVIMPCSVVVEYFRVQKEVVRSSKTLVSYHNTIWQITSTGITT